MRKYFRMDEEVLKKLFNEDPVNVWVNSFGGCRSNYVVSELQKRYSVENFAYKMKGCHYIRPLDVNVKFGVFCYVSDVGIALSSQIKRGLYHNFDKLIDDKNKKRSMDTWFDSIEKQINNWVTNPYFKTYIINTDTLNKYKNLFKREFNIELSEFKERSTKSYVDELKGYEDRIENINNKLESLTDFGYIS